MSAVTAQMPFEDARRIIESADVCPDDLETLRSHSDAVVRLNVAARTEARTDTLRWLSNDVSPHVRRQAASNTSTAPDVLDMLADDSDVDVQCAVASNLSTDTDTLHRIAVKWDQPPSMYRHNKLSGLGKSLHIRHPTDVVAENPNTRTDTLAVLASCPDYPLSCTIAEHPNTSPQTLRSLYEQGENSQRNLRMAANPNTPEDVIQDMVDAAREHQDEEIICTLIERNPELSENVMLRIGQESGKRVRCRLLEHSAITLPVVQMLSEHDEMHINIMKMLKSEPRRFDIDNSEIQEKMSGLLLLLSRSLNPEVRDFAAQSSHTPDDALTLLFLDTDTNVQESARRTIASKLDKS